MTLPIIKNGRGTDARNGKSVMKLERMSFEATDIYVRDFTV